MAKKVTFNGIELSLREHEGITSTLFSYLNSVINRLENGLDRNDGNFQMSVKADFDGNTAPRYSFYANGMTKRETQEKVARILRNSTGRLYDHMAGSVKFNLMVEDR